MVHAELELSSECPPACLSKEIRGLGQPRKRDRPGGQQIRGSRGPLQAKGRESGSPPASQLARQVGR